MRTTCMNCPRPAVMSDLCMECYEEATGILILNIDEPGDIYKVLARLLGEDS